MRRIVFLLVLICLCNNTFSQLADVTVDCQTPGWLSSMISYGDQQTVRNLKVTGFVNATDLRFIGSLISAQNLDGIIDLSKCNIVKDISEGEDNYLGNYLVPSEQKSIRTLIIPKSATKVEGCTGRNLYVDTLFFDCQMNEISQNCFGGKYTKLGHLYIGENVKTIPEKAFCRIPGTNSEVKLTSVHFPSTITSIGDDAFSMSELQSCNFNDLVNLEFLGRTSYNAAYKYKDYRTFGSCSPDTIIVPLKLVTYPLTAFFYKNGSHVFIGEATKTLSGGESDRYTFTQSGEGITFHINQSTPPEITYWFRYSNWFEGATVYVPKGAKKAYENSRWSNTKIIEMMPVEQLSLNEHSISLNINESFQLVASILPNNADESGVIWKSDNNQVANVSDEGLVHAVSSGTANIIAMSSDHSACDTCKVTVRDNYILIINATGNGTARFNDVDVRNEKKSFTVTQANSIIISLIPDNTYQIANVKVNNRDITSNIINNLYTINNISENTTFEVAFEAIPPTAYTLSITATGNGSVTYNDTSVRGKAQSFTVNEGTSATVSFAPDNGYRIASVKLNDTDVTSGVVNNQYTISSISANTSLSVTFEAIPPATYTLSITSTGNGSVSYNNTSIRGKAQSFTVNEGTSATVSFAPDNGYRIASVKLNDTDVTSSVVNNQYTISSISAHIALFVTFEAIPPTTYTLNIIATGNGSVNYSGDIVRNQSRQFSVTEGSTLSITLTPESGYRMATVKVNGKDETGNIVNNQLTISNVSSNINIEVSFEAIPPTLYTLTIKANGNGYVAYDGTQIRNGSKDFDVIEGGNATVTFTPDAGYRVKTLMLNSMEVNANVINGQYTISKISSNTTLEVTFEEIPPAVYALNIVVSGNGSVSYGWNTIRNQSREFSVTEGNSATVTLTPDNGYRLATVKVNGNDALGDVVDGQLTISSIASNTNVEVTFEAIPPTTYTLTIKASGNGYATYDGADIRNSSQTFTVVEGTYANLTLTPDEGYRVKSVKVDSEDRTTFVANNQYVVNKIGNDTSVEVEFEEIPPTLFNLTVSAIGNGSVAYNGTTIRESSEEFSVAAGSSATVLFSPDAGYRIKQVMLNSANVTSAVTNMTYSVNNIVADMSLEVVFMEDISEITSNGVNYNVVSYEQQTVNVASGNYEQVLTVPAMITEKGMEWKVVGVEPDALVYSTSLAAILWNAESLFNGSVSNPNLLLYVKSAEYAPAGMQNVIIDGKAENIVLSDAVTGNNFYCPKAFTASRISYEHHYSMVTGYQTTQGWETLALPFDVSQIWRQSTELVPYETWTKGNSKRPFWLYSLTEIGWRAESAIAANTPYIISMPNNEMYEASYNLSGNIMFVGENVQVKTSDNLTPGKNGNKRLVANFQTQHASENIYALNVNNLWSNNTSSEVEGSVFVHSSRAVHPFEAYMTVDGNSAAPLYIQIFESGSPTGIVELERTINKSDENWYTLDGRKLQQKPAKKGVYILNGRKTVVK